jgi:hypothetical protein
MVKTGKHVRSRRGFLNVFSYSILVSVKNFGCDFPLAAWLAIAKNLKTIIAR